MAGLNIHTQGGFQGGQFRAAQQTSQPWTHSGQGQTQAFLGGRQSNTTKDRFSGPVVKNPFYQPRQNVPLTRLAASRPQGMATRGLPQTSRALAPSQTQSSRGSRAASLPLATGILTGALLLATALPAHALEIPTFESGKQIYMMPDGYEWNIEGTKVQTKEVKMALTRAGYKIYLVIYKYIDPLDGDLNKDLKAEAQNDSKTGKAGYQIQRAWAENPEFSRSDSMIIVVETNNNAPQEREFTITPGTYWDSTHHINKANNDRLGRMIDDYLVNNYRETGDFDAALAALVKGINSELDGVIDPPHNLLQRLRDAVERANTIIDSPETTATDPLKSLRDAKSKAATILANESVNMLDAKHALDDLQNKIDTIGERITKREAQKSALSTVIGEAERVSKMSGILESDHISQFENAIANAKDLLSGRDYVAIDKATEHLTRRSKALAETFKSRSELKGRLTSLIARTETVIANFAKMDVSGEMTPRSKALLPRAQASAETTDFATMATIATDLEKFVSADEGVFNEWQHRKDELDSRVRKIRIISAEIEEALKTHESLLNEDDDFVEDIKGKIKIANEAIDEPEHLKTANLETVLDAYQTLQTKQEELSNRIEQRKAEQLHRTTMITLTALAILASLGIVGVILINSHRKYVKKKKGFDEKIAEWEEKIKKAKVNYANIDFQKDTALHKIVSIQGQLINEIALTQSIAQTLGQTQGDTKHVYEQFQELERKVTRDLNRIERHINDAKALAPQDLDKAIEKLSLLEQTDKEVAFDSTDLSEDLAPKSKEPIRINLQTFWKELEADYDALRAHWDELTNAIKAMNRTAKKDHPDTEYLKLKERLTTAGISVAWVEKDKFYPTEELLKGLDNIRQKDPVRYVRSMRDNQQALELLIDKVDVITREVFEAQQSKGEADAITVDYAAIVLSPENDPREAQRIAEQKMAELKVLLDRADDIDAVKIKANEAEAAWDHVEDLKKEVLTILKQSQETLDQANAAERDFDQSLASAEGQAMALSQHHQAGTMKQVGIEIAEAKEDQQLAKTALTEARRLFAAKDHFNAVKKAQEAKVYFESAGVDIREMHTEAVVLEGLRSGYADYYQALTDGTLRGRMITAMQEFAPFNDEELLFPGDEHMAAVLAPADIKTATNWRQQLDNAGRVEILWQRGVEIAKNLQTVQKADQQIDTAQEKLKEAIDKVKAIDPFHNDQAMTKLLNEVREAQDVVTRADQLRDQATALRQQKQDQEASKQALSAMKMYSQALQEIQDIIDECDRLEEARRQYQQRYRNMEKLRRGHLESLRGYGTFGDTGRLGEGSEIYDRLPNPDLIAEYNYFLLLQSANEAETRWQRSVERAHREYQAHLAAVEAAHQQRLAEERRRREYERQQREAADRARRESERRSRESSYSYGSRPSGGGGGGNRGGTRTVGGGGGGRGGTRTL